MKLNIVAITVNHQLRDDSFDEAQYVSDICKSLGIKHIILCWEHDKISKNLIEREARSARYNLLNDYIVNNYDSGVILTAHTLDDQIETFLMRDSMGSDNIGLACMSRVRSISKNVKIIRPLLWCKKHTLQEFLRKENISWKEDSMNHDETFLRVKYRHKIYTLCDDELNNILTKINNFAKARTIMEQQAVNFFTKNDVFHQDGYAVIEKDVFFHEHIDAQREILKRIIANVGGKTYPVTINQQELNHILNGQTITLGRCVIKNKKLNICIFRENRNLPTTTIKTPNIFIWDNRFLIKIKQNLGICVVSSKGDEVRTKSHSSMALPYILYGMPLLKFTRTKSDIAKYNNEISLKFVTRANLLDIFI